MGFFDTVKSVWSVMFGFFPSWFQSISAVLLGLFIVFIGIKIVKFIKDLLWPF